MRVVKRARLGYESTQIVFVGDKFDVNAFCASPPRIRRIDGGERRSDEC